MSLTFLALALASRASAEEGCTITAKACQNFPEFQQTQFRDAIGEEHLDTASTEATCLKRAEEFHHWCGNGEMQGIQVAATYNPKRLSQLYHPGACEKGWSQWDAFCYKFYLEMKTWAEAERVCREQDSHLVSVHSKAENNFVHGLALGLKVWIGYTDLDKDTHYQWSDSSQDDFTNFAKNCTGREKDPDCQKEDVAQQWYKGSEAESSPYMCKKSALLPMALLENTSAEALRATPWLSLTATAAEQGKVSSAQLDLKLQDVVPTESKASPKSAETKLNLAVPKGSWL